MSDHESSEEKVPAGDAEVSKDSPPKSPLNSVKKELVEKLILDSQHSPGGSGASTPRHGSKPSSPKHGSGDVAAENKEFSKTRFMEFVKSTSDILGEVEKIRFEIYGDMVDNETILSKALVEVNSRMRQVKQTSVEVGTCFNVRYQNLKSHEIALNETSMVFSSQETGSLKKQSSAFESSGSKNTVKWEITGKSLKSLSHRASELTKLCKTNINASLSESSKSSELLHSEYSKVKKAWETFEGSMTKCIKHYRNGYEGGIDPFIACRDYQQTLHSFQKQQEPMRHTMVNDFNEFQQRDIDREEKTVLLVQEWVDFEIELAKHRLEVLEELKLSVENHEDVNVKQDFLDFVISRKIIPDQQEPLKDNGDFKTVFERISPNPSYFAEFDKVFAKTIDKEGKLSRKSGTFSRSWSPVYVAISTTGYIHIFKDVNDPSPIESVPLALVSINEKDTTIFNLTFKSVGKGFGVLKDLVAKKFTFKTADGNEMAAWLRTIRKYKRIDLEPAEAKA
eukprot:240549_1